MSEILAYYDDLAEFYTEIARFPLRQHVVWPATRSLLGDVAGERLLDAGCGTGEHSADLAEEGANVVGLDASEGMLETAREQFGDRQFGGAGADSLAFERANLLDGLPFEDGCFGVVCCQMVLSHVRELGPVLDALVSALLDAGFAIDGIEEPAPDEVFRERWPDAYESYVQRPPDVLCLRGRTPRE
ncbi:type 11 methyltransferase [Salinarchaeum sp. Harcht-Bsk1]|uniref:class I SAM-dependent methyltransferase n=1 Tax=Salinarchaeum sp. Harcht-Bsk1 TaxID=1333523 RepID=UPI0003423EF7|nr:class I SAM-dependent methyltransferase [Salinarchaeum sp. Harcht-Bsk1]AGN01438.1 type 11 methyltransferase [Salinarchaeum sp. Harcht-Bsk1]